MTIQNIKSQIAQISKEGSVFVHHSESFAMANVWASFFLSLESHVKKSCHSFLFAIGAKKNTTIEH